MLALVLFWAIRPLRPRDWSYLHVLTFIALTAPPGFLYAIPVERLFDLDLARAMNAWFLAVVSMWRVALLFRYLRVHGRLAWGPVITGALLPLSFIVTVLWALNLDRVTFDLMSGNQDEESGDTLAYVVLTWIMLSGVALLAPLTCAYGYYWYRARRGARVAA